MRTVRASARELRDPEAKYVGREVARPAQLAGGGLFFEVGRQLLLVAVEEFGLLREPSGFAFVGVLRGEIVWGSSRWQRIEMDLRPQADQRGWLPVKTFDGLKFGVPRSKDRIRVDELRLRRVSLGGFEPWGITRMLGRDLGLRREIRIATNAIIMGCTEVLVWKCQNMWCLDRCRQRWRGTTLVNCTCEDGGWCSAIPTRVHCVNSNCDGSCHQMFRWSSCICW